MLKGTFPMPIYFTRRKEVRERAISLGSKNVEWYRQHGNQTDTKTSKAIERNAMGCADSYEVEFYWTEIMAKDEHNWGESVGFLTKEEAEQYLREH